MATTPTTRTGNGMSNSSASAASALVAGPLLNADSSTSGGKTVVNDAVIAKMAGIAARDVAGVYGLGGGAARALGAIRGALNNTDLTQGISVEVGESQVAVDVSIVAEYPVPLQRVADNVRSAITTAIETLVGMEVTEVNVTVNDVHLPSDDNSAETEARVQ